MKFDEETRLRLEDPFRRADDRIRQGPPGRGGFLNVAPGDERYGRYAAVWMGEWGGATGGWGDTPEAAVGALYQGYRTRLFKEAAALSEQAAELRVEADRLDAQAEVLRSVGSEFPAAPPGLTPTET